MFTLEYILLYLQSEHFAAPGAQPQAKILWRAGGWTEPASGRTVIGPHAKPLPCTQHAVVLQSSRCKCPTFLRTPVGTLSAVRCCC